MRMLLFRSTSAVALNMLALIALKYLHDRLLIKMLAVEGVVRICVIAFLEIISVNRFCAQSPSCYYVDNRTVCYFRPKVTSTRMTWDDAWTVCKEHNSTLPVIESQQIGETLKSYIESETSMTGEMWLAGREVRTNDWHWLNGKPIGRMDKVTVKTVYESNVVITRKLEYLSSYGRNPNYYICRCADCILCQNKEAIRFGNGCIFVNNDELLNVVNARNRCLQHGGDLATFEEDEDLGVLQQNRSLLKEFRQYWIGLRQNWWNWNTTDSNKEIKYSNWLIYENFLFKECLYVHIFHYKWNQSPCTVTKPFICQTVIVAGTDEVDTSTANWFSGGKSPFLTDFAIGLLITAIIIVIIVITVVLVITLKKPRNKEVNAPSRDEKPMLSDAEPTRPVEDKNTEANEMSNVYAEIPLSVNRENNDECTDEPQLGVVYATLEFDANEAVYEEPVISKQQKQGTRASEMDGTLRSNSQQRSFRAPPAEATQGTIYANI